MDIPAVFLSGACGLGEPADHSLPPDTAESPFCQAISSPGSSSHTILHMVSVSAFIAPLLIPQMMTFPGLQSSALWNPPIFPHASAALGDHFLSPGFNPHLWKPKLLETDGFMLFKNVAGGRVEFGHISTPQHYLFKSLILWIKWNSPHGTNERFNQCFHNYYYYHIAILSKSSLSPYKEPFLSPLIESSLISL